MKTTNAELFPNRRHSASGIGRAFTMIELLAVITIISIVAAMVVGLASLASRKKHDAMVAAMKNRLMLFISTYQSKMGFFPPDNANNVFCDTSTTLGQQEYSNFTAINPLLYELTGSLLVTNNIFLSFDGRLIQGTLFSAIYGRGGIANSLPDETHNFFQPLPNPKDYASNFSATQLDQLTVPVPLTGAANETNYWHYDSSSTNRHNSSSYDLWAVYSIGKDKSGANIFFTNGNW